MTNNNTQQFVWEPGTNNRETLMTQTGITLGQIVPHKDGDGDIHWGYEFRGTKYMARTKEVAKNKLIDLVKRAPQQE